MMPVIRVSGATWERLKGYAKPFEDKPEDIVNLALDALDEKQGGRPFAIAAMVPLPQKKTGVKKLPQKEFRTPLMKTVADLGGSAHVSEIRKEMEKKMAPALGEADYALVSSGDPRWWNAICWERNSLVKEGLFAEGSERGVWELTERGKALVE